MDSVIILVSLQTPKRPRREAEGKAKKKKERGKKKKLHKHLLIEINFAMKSIIDADDGCTERDRGQPLFVVGSVPGRGFGFPGLCPESRCCCCCCLSNAKILPCRHCRSPVLSFALEVARKPARPNPVDDCDYEDCCLPAGHALLPSCLLHATCDIETKTWTSHDSQRAKLLQLPFKTGPSRTWWYMVDGCPFFSSFIHIYI